MNNLSNTKKKNHNQFVRCIENIQDLSGMGHYEYAMLLNGGAFSRKTIIWDKQDKLYRITNHIDGTFQDLTEAELMNPLNTHLAEAMKKRALIALID